MENRKREKTCLSPSPAESVQLRFGPKARHVAPVNSALSDSCTASVAGTLPKVTWTAAVLVIGSCPLITAVKNPELASMDGLETPYWSPTVTASWYS